MEVRCVTVMAASMLMALGLNAQPVTVTIKAIDGLKFDVARFNVKPGANVTLTLTNVSDMSHNLLITKPGVREQVVQAALDLAEKGPQLDYIPPIDAVLWSIPVISPGQTQSVNFTAPQEEGIYPYVCTYPGHGYVMFGDMYVTGSDSLPAVASPGDTASTNVAPHPYELVPPYLYHAFVDGASPAAILVHLPKNLSYCWDAANCSLRFAWSGKFVDMADLWKGHFDASAKVLGDIFYRSSTECPLRIGDSAAIPEVQYKGYRLIKRYPEFHYSIDGLEVYELTKPKEDGFGLIREFRIPQADQPVWFISDTQDETIKYEHSAGSMENGKLKLSPLEAKRFTVTMTSYHVAFKRKNQ